MTAGGIGSRLGTESRPSQALSHSHVHWNQNHRLHQLTSNSSLLLHYEIVAAQCVELIAWLGWLCSSEIFNLKTEDMELVSPPEGAVYNLPPKVGPYFSLFFLPPNLAVIVKWILLLLGKPLLV